jgi:hypothetical protein
MLTELIGSVAVGGASSNLPAGLDSHSRLSGCSGMTRMPLFRAPKRPIDPSALAYEEVLWHLFYASNVRHSRRASC